MLYLLINLHTRCRMIVLKMHYELTAYHEVYMFSCQTPLENLEPVLREDVQKVRCVLIFHVPN